MLFISFLGNIFFYLGMLQLWDIHEMTLWARALITGITGVFVLSVMMTHLLMMGKTANGDTYTERD